MALVLADRVRETTTTTGTGAITLAGAVTGCQAFSSAIGNTNTTYYTIADQGGANWEVGLGTYTSAGNTLARTTVLSSSNAGALVTFTAGAKDVFVTLPSSVATGAGTQTNIFNIIGALAPSVGDAKFYPPQTILVTSIYTVVGVQSSAIVTALLKKNGATIATISIPANTDKSTPQSVAISILATDFLTVDVTTTGGQNLNLTLVYS